MEDKEFISELLFVVLEDNIISYTRKELDGLYENGLTKNSIKMILLKNLEQ